jgi:hypothetical protein
LLLEAGNFDGSSALSLLLVLVLLLFLLEKDELMLGDWVLVGTSVW